jgi:zinc protease
MKVLLGSMVAAAALTVPLSLSLLAALSRPAAAQTGLAFPFPVKDKTLPNGLRVYAVKYDSPGLVAYYSIVRTGSRNEVEPGKSGFAHFFEHMMFHGTEKYSLEAYNAAIKEMGADSNAFTSDDLTVYHILAGKAALPKIVEIEADRFQHLQYKQPEFQKEARAVLGEYNKNYSVPINALLEKLQDTAYVAHTYKHTTMGFLRDIETMPQQYDYSLKFFERWYRPDNAALVVTGDVEPQAVFELARRRWEAWRPGAASLATPVEPEQHGERVAHVPWSTPTLPLVALAFHAPAFDPEDIRGRALDVLAQAEFAPTGRTYNDLVLDKQWIDWMWAGVEDHRDPTLFLLVARVKESERIGPVREALEAALARAATERLTPDRLAAVASRLRYAFLGGLQTPDQVALAVANALQLTGGTAAIDASYRTLARVTAEDVAGTAAAIFRPENRTVVTLAP